MKVCRYLLSFLWLMTSAISLSADELAWPLICADGSARNCLLHIGYPDLDGDNLAANCNAPIYRGHTGTDLIPTSQALSEGVEVLAAAPGEVIFANDSLFDDCPADHPECQPGKRRQFRPGYRGGYTSCSAPGKYCSNANTPCFWCFSGNFVVLKHDGIDGVFATAYLHLKQHSVDVAIGQRVEAGDTLGFVGSSGNSSVPHLHFEVWRGGLYRPIDPWSGDCGGENLWQQR